MPNSATRRISAAAATASVSARSSRATWRSTTISVLEPDMLFMIHPNQYLPETGYLLCGEPAVLTPQGAQALTRQQAALAEIAL